MGGFCLLRSGEPAGALPQRIERAARAVELPSPTWLDLPGGVAAAWPRLLTGEAQLWQESGGDWAIAAGSFVFDDLGGSRALAAFHAAMGTAPERLLPRTLGQFALLLRRGQRVWLLHDRGGFMPVFQGEGLAATSFLLAAKLSDRLTPDPQALLEYVLSGVPLGDATPVRELRLLGPDSHLELGPDGAVERRRPPALPSEPPWPDAATATDACLAACARSSAG